MAEDDRPPKDTTAPLTGLPSGDSAEGFFDQLQAHYRECKRKAVDIEAEIEVLTEDGKPVDSGTAVIRNVSPTGALLAEVEVGQKSFPVGGFLVNVKMKSGPYAGIGFRCSPVRFVPEERGIGVKFEEIFVSRQ